MDKVDNVNICFNIEIVKIHLFFNRLKELIKYTLFSFLFKNKVYKNVQVLIVIKTKNI